MLTTSLPVAPPAAAALRRAAAALLALLAALAVPAGAAEPFVGWDEGLAEARRTGRPIVVDVFTSWCGWCKRMDREVYAREDVRAYLRERFVAIKLDAESSAPVRYEGRRLTGRSLASQFRVSGYPTTIFLRADGTHVANVPGYVPADRFLLLLRFVSEGHADRGERFGDFVRRATPR
jgi:thioredoxin-related protein